MPKRELPGKRAIVTGASSGIGQALAQELARHGVRLVLLARREERLRRLGEAIRAAGVQAEIVAGDVTDPAVRQKALDTAAACYGGLDILVNNAGIGAFGLFEKADEARLRRVMEVNFFAPAEMIRLALPLLRQGVKPIVVNIGSVLGHRAVPRSSEYCASKFAVRGLSEALRVEWIRRGIDLLVVCPGLTQTEFTASSIAQSEKPAWPEHPGMTPQYVARRIVRAMQAGRREIMPFAWGRFFCLMNWIAPSLVDRYLTRYA